MYKIGFILICFLCTLSLFGQQRRLTIYNIDNGFNTDVIKCVSKDTSGFLWIGSDEGIMRFDGKNVRSFTKHLPSNFVKSILTTSSGSIYVADDKGISQIFSTPDSVTIKTLFKASATINEINDSTVTYPKGLFEASNGDIWISEQQSVSCYDGKKLKKYKFGSDDATNSFSRSFCFTEDGYGRLWTTSFPGRLYYFDKNNDKFEQVEIPVDIQWINELLLVEKGKIWIAAALGVYELGISQDGNIKYVKHVSSIEGASCLKGTKENSILIGTWSQGVYRASFGGDNVVFQRENALPVGTINNLYYSTDEEFWICTNDGLGLLQSTFFASLPLEDERVHSGDTKYIQSITQSPTGKIYVSVSIAVFEIETKGNQTVAKYLFPWGEGFIARLVADERGLWIGDSFGGIHFYNFKTSEITAIENSKYGRFVSYMNLDSEGNMWYCSQGDKGVGKVSREFIASHYGMKKGIKNEINVIKKGDDRKLYCGSSEPGNHLYIYSDSNDRFEKINFEISDEKDKDFVVNDIAVEQNGKIWIGSSKGVFSIYNNEIKHIDLHNLHTREGIKAIAIKPNKNVWIANSLGVIKIKDTTRVLFNKMSGLPVNTITSRNLFVAYNEVIWAGTAKGLAYTQESNKGFKISKSPIPLELKMNGKPIKYGTNRQRKFDNGSYLELQFISMTYPNENILYQYRLGNNYEWSAPVKKTELVLPRLKTGEYILEIRAQQQGDNYLWSKPFKFGFEIKKAWYTRWWSIVLLIAFGATIVWLIIRLYIWRINNEKKQLEKLIHERTEQVDKQNKELEKQANIVMEANMEIFVQKEQIQKQKEKIELAYENIKLLNNIGQRITSSLSIDKIINTIFKNVFELLNVSTLSIGLIDINSDNILITKAKQSDRKNIKSKISFQDNLALEALCVRNKQEIIINDYTKEYKKYFDEFIPQDTDNVAKTIVHLPLISQDRAIGVFSVISTEANKYNELHINILRNLVNYIAIALDNAGAFKKIGDLNTMLEKKNRDITSSINYASRIQEAMLPRPDELSNFIEDFFIFFKPRDIVSGDFYWFSRTAGKIVLAAIDCTGHGVPGALMSMIGTSFLNEIVNSQNILNPDVILKKLDNKVRFSLKQDETNNSDGMDAAICVIDSRKQILEFAGAKNPLLYIQEGQLKKIKGNRQSIGGRQRKQEKFFTKHIIDISIPTKIYIFSDGFQDQVGGDRKKKYMPQNLQKLILSIHKKPFIQQHKMLEKFFDEWKGRNRQVDDILIMGADISKDKIKSLIDPEYNWNNKKILVAEDVELNFLTIKNIISITGATVDWARNGIIAIEKALNNKYDIILMDIYMPEMDGIETTKKLRESDISTPIVVQTAYTENTSKEASFISGANDYLIKPFTAELLLNTISKYLKE